MTLVQYRPTITTSKNDINLQTDEGKNVQEIIDELQIPTTLVGSLRVSINGSYIPPSTFKFITPKEGAELKILLIPQGDDATMMLKMVALIAISYWSAGLGTGWGYAVLSIGINIAASLALNAMFPPPEGPEFTETEGASAALTIAGSRNSARYDKGVQRIYGTVKNYPPYAAQPYTVSHGSSQYLYMLFDLGYGDIEISEPRIGDTLLSEYDVEYYERKGVKDHTGLTLFSNDIETESVNVGMEDGDDATARTSATDQKFVQFDLVFNGGLVGFALDGSLVQESVTFALAVRNDAGIIIDPANYSFTALQEDIPSLIVAPSGQSLTVNATSEDGFSITLQVQASIASDFLTLELQRTTSTEVGEQTINACNYSAFRTIRNGNVINKMRLVDYQSQEYATHTMVEMRIRATDQLSGVIDNFNCIASSKLRKWNGTTFDTPVVTDNPAWIYADILTGTMNQHPKADSKVNWDELKRWADFCDEATLGAGNEYTKAHTCNFVLDYSATMYNLLREVASIGRASPDIYDDKYSVIFEEEQDTKVQLFTNMNTTGFTSSRSYTELPDAIKVTFRDTENDWQMRDHIVYNDGFDITTARVFETIASPKTTSSDEAYREGRYWLKQAALRQELISFTTDIDWLEVKRGSLVGFQHDVMQVGGTVARVKSVNGTVVTLDTDANMNGNEVLIFELRPQTGAIVTDYVAAFQPTYPRVVDIGVIGATAGDLIVLNSSGQSSYDLIVKSIDVNADHTATVTCVEYAPQLFDLASAPVPTYNSGLGINYNPNATPNPVENLTLTEELSLIGGTYYASITLNYQPAPGVTPALYYIYLQNNDTYEWGRIGNTTSTTYGYGTTLLITSESIVGKVHNFVVVAVSATGEHLAPASGTGASITPTGDTTLPAAPDYFSTEDTAEHFRRFWWGYTINEPDIDLKGFEIRYTRSALKNWSAATKLHDGILLEPPFEIRALPEGAQTVMIRALDVSGNYSEISRDITFNIGERPTKNVLFEHEFSSQIIPWEGVDVLGHADVTPGNALSADTTTSGSMWNTNPDVPMWTNDDALMWAEPNDAFTWAANITVPSAGVTTLTQEGSGEIQLLYSQGTYPESFVQPENLVTDTEDLTDVSYIPSGLVVTPDTIGADGTLSNKLTADGSLNPRINTVYDNVTTIEGLTYSGSVTMWTDTGQPADVTLSLYNTSDADAINLDKPTVGSLGILDTTVNESYSQTFTLTSTPQRFHITHTFESSDPLVNFSIAIAPSAANGEYVYAGRVLINEGEVIPYIPASWLIYNGDKQGVIPYTSPVYLEADNYVVFVDSAKSVDVNQLNTLTWTTDVEDINEWFDDVVVHVGPGDTIIPLTKPFTAITNVSITLQDDGIAVTCRVISKSPTEIRVQCFNAAGTEQAAGLIDMRVQGY